MVHSILVVAGLLAACAVLSSGQESCGNPVIDPVLSSVTKVRGGEVAKKGSWPWQVRLGMRDFLGRTAFFCGGSIIDKDHILTASHCFAQGAGFGTTFFVRVGDHQDSTVEVGQKDYTVKTIRKHAQFSMTNFGVNNDIAVLELSSSIVFSDTVSPVCLPAKNAETLPGRTCVVTGWGSTVNQSTGIFRAPAQPILRPSTVLKQAKMSILDRNTCKQAWSPIAIRDYMICTYDEAEEWTANVHGEPCQGDSGGPMACKVEGSETYNVEGIVSFGAGCGQRGPAVFTRVASFIDWIDQQISK